MSPTETDPSINDAVLAMRAQLELLAEQGKGGDVFALDMLNVVIDQADVVTRATDNAMGQALVELALNTVRQFRLIGQAPVLSVVVGNALVDLASALREAPIPVQEAS